MVSAPAPAPRLLCQFERPACRYGCRKTPAVLGSIPKACLLLFSPLQIVMKDRVTDKPRGFGFVTFKEQEAADRAFQDVHVLDGRTVSSNSNRNSSSSIHVVLSDRRRLQEQQQQPLRPAVMRAALVWAAPWGPDLSLTGLSGMPHQQQRSSCAFNCGKFCSQQQQLRSGCTSQFTPAAFPCAFLAASCRLMPSPACPMASTAVPKAKRSLWVDWHLRQQRVRIRAATAAAAAVAAMAVAAAAALDPPPCWRSTHVPSAQRQQQLRKPCKVSTAYMAMCSSSWQHS